MTRWVKALLFLLGSAIAVLTALAVLPPSLPEHLRLGLALGVGLGLPLVLLLFVPVRTGRPPRRSFTVPLVLALLLDGAIVGVAMGSFDKRPADVVAVVRELTGKKDPAPSPESSPLVTPVVVAPVVPAVAAPRAPSLPAWARSIGGLATDAVTAVAVGPQGRVFAGGNEGEKDFELYAEVQTGNGTVFVAAFEPGGQPRWKTEFVVQGAVWISHLRPLADGSLLAVIGSEGVIDIGGQKRGSLRHVQTLLARFDPLGALVFVKPLNVSDARVASTDDGDLYLLGGFNGAADIGGTVAKSTALHPVVAVRLSPEGKARWVHTFGNDKPGYPAAIVVGGGRVWLLGRGEGMLELGGARVATGVHGGAWVSQLDLDGHFRFGRVWLEGQTGFASSGVADATGLIVTEVLPMFLSHEVTLEGRLLPRRGPWEVLVAHLDPDGAQGWWRTFGQPDPTGSNVDGANPAPRVTLLEGSEVLLAGNFSTQLNLGGETLIARQGDFFLARLHADGSTAAVKQFGTPTSERLHALALAGSDLILGGSFTSTLDLGPEPLVAPQVPDAGMFSLRDQGFVARIPAGSLLSP